SPKRFIEAMEERWTKDYGNVSSPALREVWAQMVEIFNSQITDPSERWPVIPAELGAGKTTAVKTYCSLLRLDDDHPGVLIVARTIEQANEYARDINDWLALWSWDPRPAFAHHSKLDRPERQDLDALAVHPVLVVCHKSYEMGLDKFAVEHARLKFTKMHQYR